MNEIKLNRPDGGSSLIDIDGNGETRSSMLSTQLIILIEKIDYWPILSSMIAEVPIEKRHFQT